MQYIFSLIREYLPKLVQLITGRYAPKFAGKVSIKVKPNRKDYFTYLVNVRYNQRKMKAKEIDKYSKRHGVGLTSYVKKAMKMVKDDSSWIANKRNRDKFINQNAIKTADELCTSIARYIWLEMSGVDLPKFEVWYLDCVNKGYIGIDRLKNFVMVKNGRKMISDSMVAIKYTSLAHNVNFTNADAMITGFDKSKMSIGLVRKGNKKRNTHTYLIAKYAGQIIMFDTWHTKYTGLSINVRHPKPDALWWIYWY